MMSADKIVFRRSAVVTDSTANGGRMGSAAVASGVRGALFPDWGLAEIAAGAQRLRKFYVHAADADNGALEAAELILTRPSPAQDSFSLALGTQTDVASGAPSAPLYGAGVLAGAAAAGATVLTVTLEASDLVLFRTGDDVWIGSSAEDGETHRDVAVVSAGASVTITLAAGDMLARDWPSGTTVASVLPLGDLETSLSGLAVTSASGGDLDPAGIALSNLGTIEQFVTLVFSGATTYSATSDALGALGAGAITGTFAPVNPAFSKPYFSIPASAWTGAFATGDSITFSTHPAAAPVWLRGAVPAGAAAYSGNTFGLFARGNAV